MSDCYYARWMAERAGRSPVLDAAQERADAIADAWAQAPQKLFEDDYTAFVEWVEAAIVPIVAASAGTAPEGEQL